MKAGRKYKKGRDQVRRKPRLKEGSEASVASVRTNIDGNRNAPKM